MAKPALAQTPTPIPTPSVPTFTVQPVGPPTIVNTTYSLDQNTGQIVAKIGYTNEYSAVNITIKNQIFSNLGSNTFYYNVRMKPHNSASNWTVLWSQNELNNPNSEDFPTQSNSEYTIIPVGIFGPTYTEYYVFPGGIPVGAETDFQVEAMIGQVYTIKPGFDSWATAFSGATSGWSNTETVTVPANIPLSPTPAPSSSTSTQTPTPTPSLTSVSSASYASLLLIALVVIAFLLAIIIFLLLYMRKRGSASSQTKITSTP